MWTPASEAQGLLAGQTWIVGVGSIVGPTFSFENALVTKGGCPGLDLLRMR